MDRRPRAVLRSRRAARVSRPRRGPDRRSPEGACPPAVARSPDLATGPTEGVPSLAPGDLSSAVQGQFFGFFSGMPVGSFRSRSADPWDCIQWACSAVNSRAVLSRESSSLSGPIWDRANRVTLPCRLERIALECDHRIGRIGDLTDHLCPCPSILRWTLPVGAKVSSAGGGRTDRWPQLTAIPTPSFLLIFNIL